MNASGTTGGGYGSLNDDRGRNESQALKFQFVDPGYFVQDNTIAADKPSSSHHHEGTANHADNAEGLSAFDELLSDKNTAHSMSNLMNNLNSDVPIQNNPKYDKSSYVSTTFSCHVYYPYQFRALRRRLYNGEDDFIESLSRCQQWNALGGKSGVPFKKTLDHRFILKFVKQNEFKMFLDNAQSYFEHMASVLFKNYPSVLVHILGVYQISWIKTNKSQLKNRFVIVMPNLWYSKNITKQFDLKGSLRNRYVEEAEQIKSVKEREKHHHDSVDDDENGVSGLSDNVHQNPKTVMLDKNFIEYMRGFPMTLEDNSKQHLHKAVHNDTLFLCRSDVIDYSLLVGINEENNELVVGIIDYLRTYTWDKAVEEQAKSLGMVIGRQAPTIVRPKNYKQRFREAMERYFMVAPDRKTKRINRPKDKTLTQAVKEILIHC